MKENNERMLADIKKGLSEYSLDELRVWAQHVLDNPYRGEDVSAHVIEMINWEIAKRLEATPTPRQGQG
jgi:hypothetical protein